MSSVARRLHVGRGISIGPNTWYLFANGHGRGVFKVRRGMIEEIGIADRRLTRAGVARRFMASFS